MTEPEEQKHSKQSKTKTWCRWRWCLANNKGKTGDRTVNNSPAESEKILLIFTAVQTRKRIMWDNESRVISFKRWKQSQKTRCFHFVRKSRLCNYISQLYRLEQSWKQRLKTGRNCPLTYSWEFLVDWVNFVGLYLLCRLARATAYTFFEFCRPLSSGWMFKGKKGMGGFWVMKNMYIVLGYFGWS